MPASGNLAFSAISAGQLSTPGTTAGGMVCWGAIVSGLSGTPLPSLVFTYNGFQSVSVGYNPACAVTVAGSWGEAYCWGNNQYRQVGVDPASAPSVVPAARVVRRHGGERRGAALKAQGGELAIRVQAGRYDTSITAGASPSFLARRANLRSSNVATLSQDL